MLSLSKPLAAFGQLDQYLSKYGTHFEFCREKKPVFVNDIHCGETIVILEGVISLRRNENILIGIAQAPFIIGLADGMMKNESRY